MKDLQDFPLFKGLEESERISFLSTCEASVLRPEETLIVQGTHGDRVYLVVSGSLRIFVEANGGEHEIARVTAPAVLGEMEFLTKAPRTASAQTVTEVHVVHATYQVLEKQMSENNPATLKVFCNIARVLCARLAEMDRKITEMALLPSVRPKELQALHQKLFEEWSL